MKYFSIALLLFLITWNDGRAQQTQKTENESLKIINPVVPLEPLPTQVNSADSVITLPGGANCQDACG